jgi:hypothetical protein
MSHVSSFTGWLWLLPDSCNRDSVCLQADGERVADGCAALWTFASCGVFTAGPAKSRRDDLLTKRDGLRQQQLAAEGQLEAQLKYVWESSCFELLGVSRCLCLCSNTNTFFFCLWGSRRHSSSACGRCLICQLDVWGFQVFVFVFVFVGQLEAQLK